MRRRSLLSAVVALSAGLSAAAAVRGLVRRRRAAAAPAAPAAVITVVPVPTRPQPRPDAVVLPFAPRVVAEPPRPARPTAPVRCGDTGGRTRAGTPCAARATAGGRCHHHPMVA